MELDTYGLALLIEQLNAPCQCEQRDMGWMPAQCARPLTRWWRADEHPRAVKPVSLYVAPKPAEDLEVAAAIWSLWKRLRRGRLKATTRAVYRSKLYTRLEQAAGKKCSACGREPKGMMLVGSRGRPRVNRLVVAQRTATSAPVLICRQCVKELGYTECA